MALNDLMRQLGLAALAGLFLAACSTSETRAPEPAPMDSLVSVEWLHQHLNDPDLVVLDATVMVEQGDDGKFINYNGRGNYETGHIPGAGFADLLGDELRDTDSPFDIMAPDPGQFAAGMAALGVSDDSRVVIYDVMGGVWSARVWWMLRWIGFDRAALLDGGIKAWTDAGYPLSTEPVVRKPGRLSVNPRPQLFSDRHEVLDALSDSKVHVIDSLSAAHYSGEWTMYARPGHIPTAVNVSVFQLFDEAGQFRSNPELAGLFSTPTDQRTITYCGGGIAAASNAFTLVRLGYTDVAIYDGSLEEWAADPELPMSVSPDPEFDEVE
ncbi:MAG: sulfurtransferase [Xanthomonadales bacterium]|nr:sulfurtransferase [Xanthomonadales bacterium]